MSFISSVTFKRLVENEYNCVQKDSEIVPGLSRKICHNQLAMFKIGTKGDIVAHTSHFCHFCFRIQHQQWPDLASYIEKFPLKGLERFF